MAGFRTLDDLGEVTGKVALVRVDLNLPMDGGQVTDETRIRAAARRPSSNWPDKGAKVLLLAHFGRPKGQRSSTQSLSMVIDAVQEVLGQGSDVRARNRRADRRPDDRHPAAMAISRCSKTRASGRARRRTIPNWPRRSRPMAISTSTTPFPPRTAPMRRPRAWRISCPSYAGRSMQAELEALEKALGNPEKPVAAVVGGAKVSSKLDVLDASGRARSII